MDITTLAAWGEFIGGVAVVVSLIYLASQIRQNTTSVRAASRLEVASSWRACNRLLMDREARRTRAKGLRDYPAMPFDERSLFVTMLADESVFFQGTFALYDEGQLDEGTYQDYLNWFAAQVATPGGSNFWTENSPNLVKGAAAAVNERLAKGGLPDITQLGGYRLDDA